MLENAWAVHTKLDLGNSAKWMFGDTKEFGCVLLTIQDNLRELKQQRASLQKALWDLDNNMPLKGAW